ncbi:MAG: ABC transporter permease [Egibacteraceae bacterium]
MSAAKRLRSWLPAGALLLGVIAVWEAAVRVLGVPTYILPAPSGVAEAFLRVRELLVAHTLVTTAEALIGLLAGALVGVALAVLLWALPPVRRMLYPLLVTSQTVPMVVLAPLLVLWFGFGLTPKVLVVALITFFPVVVSTVQGLAGADEEQIELVESMGASRAQVLRLVLVPTAVPAFFAGLRIAAAYAVAGAVIGEWVGASSGLGLFITRSQASFQVDQVFVGVGVITALSIVIFATVHGCARLASPWRYADDEPLRAEEETAS